jgi:gamma-glutamyltranspeptidase/glutathione hydrolase
MPLKRIIEPALALARNGFEMNKLQAYIFGVVGGIYLSTEASRAIFCSREEPGKLVREGETVFNPAFADALESLANEGDDLFYFGEIAARIDEDCRSGGALTRADLEAYRIERRTPLSLDYRDARLYTNPPPSTGGILIAFALELIKGVGWGQAEFGSSAHLHRLVRVMELTNTARVESRLHQTNGEDAAETLLDPALIDAYRAKVLDHPKALRGTTHISVIDRDGNAAALTLSNGEGAGYIVPGTGIMMNNMLGEEDIMPHGFHQWPADTRMCSMMAPSLVSRRDGELIALGSGGSNRIRTAMLQVLSNILDFDMSLDAAINSPRIHFEADRLSVESGLNPDQVADLVSEFSDYKLWDERNMFFGGAHAVRFDPSSDDFSAAGDPRRGGSATVL